MIAWSYVLAPRLDSDSWLVDFPYISQSHGSGSMSFAIYYSESYDDVTFTWNDP